MLTLEPGGDGVMICACFEDMGPVLNLGAHSFALMKTVKVHFYPFQFLSV